MVNAVTLPASGSARRSRSHWHASIAPLFAFVPDAILLGLLRVFTLAAAPRHGVYFTMEALLIVYACFAIVRAVHISANGRDDRGHYSRERARKAQSAFYAGLRQRLARIGLVVLPLLLAALLLDMLTAGTGAQHRFNIHLTLMFVELAAWLRYGSMLTIASARWASPRRPSLAKARVIIGRERARVARSLWPAHLLLCTAALASLVVYGGRSGSVVVVGSGHDPRLVLCWTAAACAVLAWLAIARLCHGSLTLLRRDG
jgi:hypothetical protein